MWFPALFGSTPTRSASKGGDWANWIGGMSRTRTSAGAGVNSDNALRVGALRACVTLLAESVAQLPCELYRRTGDGGRERASQHPVYDLLHSQPNQKDSSFEYFEQGQGALGLEGNHYALIERDGAGYPIELIPINPKKCQVMKGRDGLPYYHLPEVGKTVGMRQMHHVKAFSRDGFVGLSPIATNADSIGLAMSTEEHAAAVFERGATMSGVIERPSDATAIKDQAAVDRLLDKFTERHGGLRNAFSVALLQEGMSYKQLSMDNEKAQLLESRKFSVEEICRLFKIPLHMVQLTDKSTSWGSGIESMSLGFVIYTLLPWLKRWEAAMRRDLLLPSERRDLYVEFNVSGLLRGDQKSRYDAYALGRQWGWLSVNDVRRLENMPPIAGGDRYLTPLNMNDSQQTQRSLNATPKQMQEIEGILCRN
ncbi:phage portal protein [Salinicola sp. JS01]|uniref:phage portal protein n=1 Tax=Salinicola sp. JS01 TaxID=3050071 RepID=UPI00255BD31F|nr:phage portal protein [Salinicola sp. JS01]WIX32512.1 phage portal protein [Salinicola sp. JS01]